MLFEMTNGQPSVKLYSKCCYGLLNPTGILVPMERIPLGLRSSALYVSQVAGAPPLRKGPLFVQLVTSVKGMLENASYVRLENSAQIRHVRTVYLAQYNNAAGSEIASDDRKCVFMLFTSLS